MQSMPLLLRQSLRSTTPLSRSAHPFRSSRPQALLQLQPHLPAGRTRPFSVCPQCQFQTQSPAQSSSSSNSNDKSTDDERRAAAAAAAAQSHSTAAFLEESLRTQAAADAGEPIPLSSPQGAGARAGAAGSPRPGQEQGQEQVKTQQSTTAEGNGRAEESRQKTQSHGGLPSYLEDRRSQFSKQFTTMMDNLQSNVFVAGQRLNDLTGYSEIEALKKDIHTQEDRLLKARAHVRSAKEAYASAINNRSASQREVNELLQRKHAWSPVDLERFTHLYRNDHTNEVAENEAQEALTAAERESEEAAAQLSKSILSRYHEEQVWSDKIRRMSTWGTWGLMGVNVLLFLIFQIGVEPWRRKRLVKGFEDKVIEAIEKEKGLGVGVAQSVVAGETAAVAAASTPAEAAPVATDTTVAAAPATLEEDTAADRSVVVADSATEAATPEVSEVVSKDPVYESYRTQIPALPGTVSVDAWRQYFHDLFSDRGMIITQRDLSTVALQSAAAGAAIMGLVIAVIRPR